MTMRAVLYEKFGPPEVLQLIDYPLPQRSSGNVLVKISCTSVNPVDLKIRKGSIAIAIKHKILGGDLAGVVEAADADSEFVKGDRVFALSPDWSFRSKWGCYAEYATIKSSLLARIPDSISFEQAAALPMVSLTAMQALEAAQVKSGQRVLIHGGSGGVGSAGVQIAKAWGAHVTSTCSTKNMQLVKELRADEVTDYTQTSVDQVFKDKPFDAVLDVVGAVFCLQYQLRCHTSSCFQDGRCMKEKSKLVAAGQLKPIIDKTFPLEQAVVAHRHAETGRPAGKIVITVAV